MGDCSSADLYITSLQTVSQVLISPLNGKSWEEVGSWPSQALTKMVCAAGVFSLPATKFPRGHLRLSYLYFFSLNDGCSITARLECYDR